MKQIYDPETDTITVRLSDSTIEDTDELSPGILADYDADGNIVGYEFMQASRRFPDPYNADIHPFMLVLA